MGDIQKAGKYEIQKRIGEGGFGVVYLGHDPFIKRPVAIKTCTSPNEETRKRFLREAEIAGAVEHPNITIVYDFGFEDETPYLVQEFLSGEDLDHIIRKRQHISVVTKVDYLLQIAQGLGFAHEHGITHRDIKPANIRVLEDERIKIMDFGIAKLASEDTQLTQTGTTLGTPAYLSPEQLRGNVVDRRADIYSFGVMAFELMTYQRLYDADTISTLFFQILHRDPRALSDVWPECPPALDEMIGRCVKKDPDERYASFREVIAVLQPLLQEIRASGLDMSPDLLPVAKSSTDSPSAEQTRQQQITEARQHIEKLLASGQLREAARSLIEARQALGDALPFRNLQDQLIRQTGAPLDSTAEGPEVTAAVSMIEQHLNEGDLEGASRQHDAAVSQFGELPALLAAGRRIRLAKHLGDGTQALESGDLATASNSLQRAYELAPDHPEVQSSLRRLRELGGEEILTVAPLPPPPPSQGARPPRVTLERPVDDATVITPGAKTGTVERPEQDDTVISPAISTTQRPMAIPTSTRQQPQPSGTAALPQIAESTGGIPWKLVGTAAAVILLLIVALVVWRSVDRGATDGGLASFDLDVSPWARVVSVVAEDGSEQPIGDQVFAPVSLRLAPGRYTVTLENADLETERTIEVVVGADGARERVELVTGTARSYFEEIGW